MKIAAAMLLTAGTLLLGCAEQDSPAETVTVEAPQVGSAEADVETTRMTEGDQPVAELKPPAADSVLYLIYRRDGNGAVSYEIENGATVSYWFGHAFDFKGVHYFTGFASRTNDREGDDSDSEYTMEGGRVALSQATLRLTDEFTGKQEWALVETDGYVGEFGGNDRAETHDGSRAPVSHETADGRLLLAVPTRSTDAGNVTSGYALLLFDPDAVDALPFRIWGYVGSVSMACNAGAECAASLAFSDESDDGLPRVQLQDGEGGTAVHAFDAATARYAPR